MKTYSQYITEAEGGDLKKAIKKNGFIIPSSFKFSNNCFSYRSSKGYRGESVIDGVKNKLIEAGWEVYDKYDSCVPDGSRFDYGTVMLSPDKTVLYKKESSYGGTSYSNMYSAYFILVRDEESYLTKRRNFEELNNYIKTLGINYAGMDGMVDDNTWVCKSALVKNIIEKIDTWKAVGENEWEKGNCRVTYKPDKPWGEVYVTFINTPDPIKIMK